MRKSLLVATTATLAVSVAGVAYAQLPAPAPTSKVKVAPTKAGTKAKPKGSTLTLSVKNNDESKTTASQIAITLPSTLKLSTKGLNQCKLSDEVLLEGENDPLELCKSAIAGKGEAHAKLNPYSTTPAPINFEVTPLVGKNELLFYLKQTNGGVRALLHGTISGKKLTIKISPELQQPAPGAYSALSDLSTTLKAKKGKNNLLVSTGCTGGKHKIGVTLTYVPNGQKPAKTTASAPAEAKCSK